MKNIKNIALISLLLLSPLSGCQKANDPVVDKEKDDYSKQTEGEKDGLVTPDPSKVISDFKAGEEIVGEEKEVTKVRFHYHRTDNKDGTFTVYKDFYIWVWDSTNGLGGAWYKFDSYDSFGVYKDVELSVVSGGKSTQKIGFIIAYNDWSSKDVTSDRFVEIEASSKGGIQEVYLRSKIEKTFTSSKDAFQSTLKYARLDGGSLKKLVLSFRPIDNTFEADIKKVKVTVNGKEMTNISQENYDSKNYLMTLLLPNELKLTDVVKVSYAFDSEFTDTVDMLITSYYDSTEFKERYVYTGNDLGVTYDNEEAPTKTTFKVWAPTSTKMVLNIYNTGDYRTETKPANTYEMRAADKGVFEYTVDSNLDGKYYTYTVTNSNGTNEVVDPYAKSAGLNGRRGMILNFHRLNATISGWNEDTRPDFGVNGTDASIYEIHVRDMTINPNSGVDIEKRGKFLGLAQKGTTYTENDKTVKTGLDHLKELGITHIQIQPFYDYSSVDESLDNKEMSDKNYNWGYDPLNYNCLEGSYSSNPSNGETRVKEFKEMVMALHSYGININMDVVYNHMSSLNDSNFQLLVPNYYFRISTSGRIYNGSGCGNEIASERAMARKFLLDSTTFWTNEYHLSGFRFDLMGLIDNQTMIDVYDANKAIYDKIMVYGEPWTGGSSKLVGSTDPSKLDSQQTVQSSLSQSYFAGNRKFVGAFNDIIRNAIRGDNNPSSGYVQGDSANASNIVNGIKGIFSDSAIEPEQVLNYVSCHDNYTLYDQIVQTAPIQLEARYSQAESLIFLSQGVPFLQEGEDFMRSKNYTEDGKTKYSGNSYNVGDNINDMDYSLKVKNNDMFEKFKELIKVRKENPELSLPTRSEIQAKLTDIKVDNGNIQYTITGDNTLEIIHSLSGKQVTLDGNYDVIYRSRLGSSYQNSVSSITLSSNESVVLKKVK